MKRLIDVLFSFAGILILLPFFIAIAIMIRLDGPGPAIFTQTRWGMGGRKITVLKFRSMRLEQSDPSGIEQTVKDDPRVTRIGIFLRRSNLDELPQLFNVLKGDMSLVGPRCHAIGMKAAGVQYEELVPHYHERHQVRPGITGLAQMRGLRGPTDSVARSRARIVSDIYYIRNFSLLLDLKIVLGTLRNEIFGGTGF